MLAEAILWRYGPIRVTVAEIGGCEAIAIWAEPGIPHPTEPEIVALLADYQTAQAEPQP